MYVRVGGVWGSSRSWKLIGAWAQSEVRGLRFGGIWAWAGVVGGLYVKGLSCVMGLGKAAAREFLSG